MKCAWSVNSEKLTQPAEMFVVFQFISQHIDFLLQLLNGANRRTLVLDNLLQSTYPAGMGKAKDKDSINYLGLCISIQWSKIALKSWGIPGEHMRKKVFMDYKKDKSFKWVVRVHQL
jgi:hypothetical protein